MSCSSSSTYILTRTYAQPAAIRVTHNHVKSFPIFRFTHTRSISLRIPRFFHRATTPYHPSFIHTPPTSINSRPSRPMPALALPPHTRLSSTTSPVVPGRLRCHPRCRLLICRVPSGLLLPLRSQPSRSRSRSLVRAAGSPTPLSQPQPHPLNVLPLQRRLKPSLLGLGSLLVRSSESLTAVAAGGVVTAAAVRRGFSSSSSAAAAAVAGREGLGVGLLGAANSNGEVDPDAEMAAVDTTARVGKLRELMKREGVDVYSMCGFIVFRSPFIFGLVWFGLLFYGKISELR